MTGFFGVGGGVLIVPALTVLLGLTMRRAVATSLAIITITGLAALTSHLAIGSEPDWPLTFVLSAAAVSKHVSGVFTKLGFLPEDENRRVRAVLIWLRRRGI